MNRLPQPKRENEAQRNIRHIGFGVALGIAMTLATAANYISKEKGRESKPMRAAQKAPNPIESEKIDQNIGVKTKAQEEPENKKAATEIREISDNIETLCNEFLTGMLRYNQIKNHVLGNEKDTSIIKAGERAEAQLQADLEILETWKHSLAQDDPLQIDIKNCLSVIESFVLKHKPTLDEYKGKNRH